MKEAWEYGKAHKEHPIELEECWEVGGHKFHCTDLHQWDSNPFGDSLDFAYVDPPWNQSAIQGYYTKAGRAEQANFEDFTGHLCMLLASVKHDVFLEIGKQQLSFLTRKVQESGGEVLNIWNTTYYQDRPSHLLRVGWNDPILDGLDLEGMDDNKTPAGVAQAIAQVKSGATLYDACTGLGTTTLAAISFGLNFVGTELHPHRLAWAIKLAFEVTGGPVNKVNL